MLKPDADWTIFLDRDGVINERIIDDYVKSPNTFVFTEKAAEAIAKLSRMVKYVIVVTNQQGIGKGLMTERNLSAVHDYMCAEVQKKGGEISACYFAPYLAAENNRMRKPNIGMAEEAMKDFPDIDLKKAVMVGDSDSDIQFGRNLGICTVRIKGFDDPKIPADYNFESLNEFVETISK